MKLRGMVNLGNTCYFNSCIQSVLNTPLIRDHLLTQDHSNSCYEGEDCVYCMLEDLAVAYSKSKGIVAPKTMIKNVRRIGKNFKPGRQEDAHEFLVKLLEIMTKGRKRSFVQEVFGGSLNSLVVCKECGHETRTIDECMGVSLEMGPGDNLSDLLEHYTQEEDVFERDGGYKCEKCDKVVPVTKTISLERMPQVFTIHLKRFDFTESRGGKITTAVQYPEYLDASPYLSGSGSGGNIRYMLYAVVVHYGQSTETGHYYSFVRSQKNKWFLLDDEAVEEVFLSQVLDDQAYILFYIDEEKFHFRDFQEGIQDKRKGAVKEPDSDDEAPKGKSKNPDHKDKDKDPDGPAAVAPKSKEIEDVQIHQKVTILSEEKKGKSAVKKHTDEVDVEEQNSDDELVLTTKERIEFFFYDVKDWAQALVEWAQTPNAKYWIVDIGLPTTLLFCCCVVCCLVVLAIFLTILTSVVKA